MERNERKLQKRNLKRKLLEVLRNFIKNTNTLVYVQFKNLQKLRPSMSKVHHTKCKPWLYHHDSKEGVTKDFLWMSVRPGGVCFCRRGRGGGSLPSKTSLLPPLLLSSLYAIVSNGENMHLFFSECTRLFEHTYTHVCKPQELAGLLLRYDSIYCLLLC